MKGFPALAPSKKYKFLLNSDWLDLPEDLRPICAARITGSERHIMVLNGRLYDRVVVAFNRDLEKQFTKLITVEAKSCSAEELAACYKGSTVTPIYVSEKTKGIETIATTILNDAIAANASDLKAVIFGEETYIRLAIAGREFTCSKTFTAGEGDALLHLLFDLRDEGGGQVTLQKTEFQPFSITRNEKSSNAIPSGILKLRGQMGFHEGPNEIQKHMVLRLFLSGGVTVQTDAELGFDPEVCAALERARRKMAGAVVIAGVTGDGKTSTIISSLRALYHQEGGKISIISAEDPVEFNYNLPGVIQIPIQGSSDAAKRDRNYIEAIRHFLRSKPHAALISELRDLQSAKVLTELVETGHQAWTTVHVSSAVGILFRIIDLGLPPAQLAKPNNFTLLLKQTLVRVLCDCKIAEGDAYTENPEGCEQCLGRHTSIEAQAAWAGVARLMAVAEYIEPDDEFLAHVRAHDMLAANQHWQKNNVTLADKIGLMYQAGVISRGEALRKGGNLTPHLTEIMTPFKTWIECHGNI